MLTFIMVVVAVLLWFIWKQLEIIARYLRQLVELAGLRSKLRE